MTDRTKTIILAVCAVLAAALPTVASARTTGKGTFLILEFSKKTELRVTAHLMHGPLTIYRTNRGTVISDPTFAVLVPFRDTFSIQKEEE
jgi:hypothetical protein